MDTVTPSKQLLARVRGNLIIQGSSLSKWCAAQGIDRVWANDALIGKRNGPNAQALRMRIVREVLRDAS